MTRVDHLDDPIILQRLQMEEDRNVATVPIHIDVNTKERYELWSDIQLEFPTVAYAVEKPMITYSRRTFFMVDEKYQL
jgi:hypothetical protein